MFLLLQQQHRCSCFCILLMQSREQEKERNVARRVNTQLLSKQGGTECLRPTSLELVFLVFSFIFPVLLSLSFSRFESRLSTNSVQTSKLLPRCGRCAAGICCFKVFKDSRDKGFPLAKPTTRVACWSTISVNDFGIVRLFEQIAGRE